ncbi:unnamed protein product [marine sediment metagenome]|uniref:Uncharacterized protein n=1 Tax=marine sediment metagenome TaxID=412755 RepID=X1BVW4_9ZZZZ
MSVFSTIKIDRSISKSNRQEIKKAKAIFDKLKLPHIVDDISFHNTSIDLHRMKALHNTDSWKVERDGSLSLSNRFGHSRHLTYREMSISSIEEFNFVDLYSLSSDESEFLADLLYKFEGSYNEPTPTEKQKAI